ncbi:MAG: D-lyxose/D-mannose family sugar isomerase [Sedimentitalea sp.]
MLRSQVNEILAESAQFIASFGMVLPPFATYRPDQIRAPEAALIRDRRLGWDITDYGQGRFADLGLVLFTTRNGQLSDLSAGRGMLYAEKVMISRVAQISPMHRHVLKTEDIINRGGGDLVLELFMADPDGGIDRAATVTTLSDGVAVTLPAGGHLRLSPGQSVTLHPNVWHAFWAERADCMICEVSTVNDDETDNLFEQPIGRFSTLTEDCAPTHLLVSDYGS